MYTICLGILPAFLGTNAVGKGSGIMPCAAGLLSLVNIPLASWAVNSLGGNFFYPNLMYTLVVLPCIYLAWSLGQGMKREDKAKNRLVRSKRDKQEDEGHSVSVQVNEGQSACEKPLNADKIE
jgi:hypothetical protein